MTQELLKSSNLWKATWLQCRPGNVSHFGCQASYHTGPLYTICACIARADSPSSCVSSDPARSPLAVSLGTTGSFRWTVLSLLQHSASLPSPPGWHVGGPVTKLHTYTQGSNLNSMTRSLARHGLYLDAKYYGSSQYLSRNHRRSTAQKTR